MRTPGSRSVRTPVTPVTRPPVEARGVLVADPAEAYARFGTDNDSSVMSLDRNVTGFPFLSSPGPPLQTFP